MAWKRIVAVALGGASVAVVVAIGSGAHLPVREAGMSFLPPPRVPLPRVLPHSPHVPYGSVERIPGGVSGGLRDGLEEHGPGIARDGLEYGLEYGADSYQESLEDEQRRAQWQEQQRRQREYERRRQSYPY
jgi:hypothetical protein